MVYEWLRWRTDLKLIGKKRYIVDWVDKGCQWFTSVYSIGGILKVVEHSNIKEYETDKKM